MTNNKAINKIVIFLLTIVFLFIVNINLIISQTKSIIKSIVIDGIERNYTIYNPDDLSNQIPLVIVLHENYGSAKLIEVTTKFSLKAEKEKFLVIYPDGYGEVKSWNSGYCCGFAYDKKTDDVKFIREIIENTIKEYDIDKNRIYITGFSNGAMMTHRLGAELSDIVAAIAPVSGSIGGNYKASYPTYIPDKPKNVVSVIIFHGLRDNNIKYYGGTSGGIYRDRIDLAVSDAVDFWTEANDCGLDPKIEINMKAKVIIDTYIECNDNSNVILYTFEKEGHEWFKDIEGIEEGEKLNATDIIWDFFKTHPKSN